jgi:tRNA(fMet)-specific endonuclease VapC
VFRIEQPSGSRASPVDRGAAETDVFAEVRADLGRAGTPIGSMDTMIAAYAKAIKAVLVTNNRKHFRRVKGLAIENWTK